ncbi:MAG: metallophosphoesterase [Nannocystaceae bacterium]|nr:metallophosphoesterase [Nannocystaceae bacterium]
MTDRTFSLGRDGEAQWDTLRAAYVLSPDSGQLELVVSDSREVRAEVRRRMAAMSPELRVISPSEGVVVAIHACAKAGVDHDTVPVAWVEASSGEDPADENKRWIEALAVLNQARDTLQMHGPCHVILAGREALHATVTQRAPDLASFLNSAMLLGDTLEPLASDPGVLTWMHLSDLHVGREDWQRDDVLGALVRDLSGLLAQGNLHPDLLLVTGDVADKGTKADYDGAFVVLEKITEILGIDRRQHVYMVAGNHDVDRGKVSGMVVRYHDSLVSLGADKLRDAVGTLLGDADDFGMYGKRLAQWCAFTDRFLGRARSVSLERPWRSDVIDVAGIKLGVISLCTAWASGSDQDNGRLLLGERQLAEMVSEVRDGGAQLVVGLMHHPLDWLHPNERVAIRGRFERDVDLLLHGHLHAPHTEVQFSGGSRQVVTIGAGAAYAGLANDRYHGFSVGRLDPAAKTVTAHHFTWSTAAGKWHIDPGAPGADDKGRVVLPMALPTLGTGAPPTGGAAVLATRLRQAAARVYDSVDFAGLGSGGPRRHVTLADLFVPLRLRARGLGASERQGADAEAHGVTVETLAESLFSSRDDATRVVVLGAPGSGKSTLCRYLTTTAARQEGGPVPLLLTVRDWVAEGGREGLLEMAAREATQRLSVRTDAERLEELCADGGVLLIIDGIDEAPDADTRRKLRERVLGLASRFPNVAILVTSRVTGYDDVPLDDSVFDRMTLEPFDDDALASFIRRWYDVAEPDDPIVRRRKRVDLTVALDREPRAKELARNPLLATLIAMVHFTHARLPGDRAKLYGQIVELLLITWPADRGRRFAALDGVTQMPMLERVALAMQEQSEAGARKAHVLVDTALFVEMLAGQLRERSPECGEYEILDLARRWSRWLVRDAGLVQEHSAGRVGFLHLSLMEYMAGRALLAQYMREGYDAVAALVEERCEDPRWEETLLLMLGRENENRALGEAVVERLLGGEWSVSCALFLLNLLVDDVDVGAPLRERILERTSGNTLQWHGGIRNWVDELVDDIASFGRLHRQGTVAWFRERVTSDSGDALASALALCPPAALTEQEVFDIVSSRADVDAVACTLLDFGGLHRWRRLGLRVASRGAMVVWAETTPVEGAVRRSVTAASSAPPGDWIVPLLQRSGWIAATIVYAAKKLQNQSRGDGRRGTPWTLLYSIDESRRSMAIRPAPAVSGTLGGVEPFFAHEFWRDAASENLGIMKGDHIDFLRRIELYSDIPRPARSNLAQYDTAVPTLISLERTMVKTGIGGGEPPLYASARAVVGSAALSVPGTSLYREHGFLSDWSLAVAADVHAGIIVSPAHDTKTGDLLARLRLENLWLNVNYFDQIGSNPNDNAPPDHHALMLTFGLVQYQTTWQWPASPHWPTWFTSSPPEHWLPAHLWHIIRSIQDPTNTSHREAADACLDRSDSPTMAEALRKHVLTPTPPEVLALFDRGEADPDDT